MPFNRRFDFVHDARRYGANLVCVCPRCGHRVAFERETLIAVVEQLGINPMVEVVAARLRCTGCRRRGCVLELSERPDPTALELRDGASLPPPGLRISITRWCQLDESERKRLRRAAR